MKKVWLTPGLFFMPQFFIMIFQYRTVQHKTLSDLHSPVSVYLRIRDKYPQSILLESSDYHSKEESFSYICCEPIAQVQVENNTFKAGFPDGQEQVQQLTGKHDLTNLITAFQSRFDYEELNLPFSTFGLFGYSSYSSVQQTLNYTEFEQLVSKMRQIHEIIH